MYIKFFKNQKGGSTKSIDYLLNDRVADGTAKILKGNEQLTRDLIQSITTKQKVTVGVLSFEEENLSISQKEELMIEFEKTLFPGLDQEQYNILWVEHRDKERLELNFVVPKIELSTQKAFNPYYHAVDFPRIEMFEDIYNIKYNLTSKKDPSKAQTVLGSKKEVNLFKDYKQLDEQLHKLVMGGDIKNREHLIELLTTNNIQVTRQNSEWISVKLPESKRAKRLKGSIYHEQFTSIRELEGISERAEQSVRAFQQRDTRRELEETLQRLEQYNGKKAGVNRGKYIRKSKPTLRQKNSIYSDVEWSSSRSDGNVSVPNAAGVDSSTTHEIPARPQELHHERECGTEQRPINDIHRDTEVEDDIRRRTIKRNRERAEEKRRIHEKDRGARVKLYQDITAESRAVRAKLEQGSQQLQGRYGETYSTRGANLERVRRLQKQSASDLRLSKQLDEGVENISKQSANCLRLSKQLNSASGTIQRSRESVKNLRKYSDEYQERKLEIKRMREARKRQKPQSRGMRM